MPGKSKSPKKTVKVTDLSAVKNAKDVKGGFTKGQIGPVGFLDIDGTELKKK